MKPRVTPDNLYEWLDLHIEERVRCLSIFSGLVMRVDPILPGAPGSGTIYVTSIDYGVLPTVTPDNWLPLLPLQNGLAPPGVGQHVLFRFADLTQSKAYYMGLDPAYSTFTNAAPGRYIIWEAPATAGIPAALYFDTTQQAFFIKVGTNGVKIDPAFVTVLIDLAVAMGLDPAPMYPSYSLHDHITGAPGSPTGPTNPGT